MLLLLAWYFEIKLLLTHCNTAPSSVIKLLTNLRCWNFIMLNWFHTNTPSELLGINAILISFWQVLVYYICGICEIGLHQTCAKSNEASNKVCKTRYCVNYARKHGYISYGHELLRKTKNRRKLNEISVKNNCLVKVCLNNENKQIIGPREGDLYFILHSHCQKMVNWGQIKIFTIS